MKLPTGARVAFPALLLLAVACENRPAARPDLAVGTATTSTATPADAGWDAVAAVDAGPVDAAAEDTSVPATGPRFYPVAEIPSQDVSCPIRLRDLAVVPGSDEAWFVGWCSLRIHYDQGRFTADRIPRVARVSQHRVPCSAVTYFDAVFARSHGEVYAAGATTCILSDSWARPLDRFDGAAWRLRPAVATDAQVDAFAQAAGGPLCGLVREGDLHRPANDRVHCRGATGWGNPLRTATPRGLPATQAPEWDTTRFERYRAITAPDATSLWVVGAAYVGHQLDALASKKNLRAMAWRWDGTTWTEHAVDDGVLEDVWTASDGSVWAVGRALWRLTEKGAQRVELGLDPGTTLTSVWARHEKDVWAGVDGHPFIVHHDGAHATRVPIEGNAQPTRPRVRGGASAVWMTDLGTTVYRLAEEAPVPVEVRVVP